MLILALDPSATQTGAAFYRPSNPIREAGIVCSSFSTEGKNAGLQCESYGRWLTDIFETHRPDFVVFEEAIRQIFNYQRKPDWAGARGDGPSADQLLLCEIQGHIRQACIDRKVPHESVPVRTWRAAIYGKGGGSLPRDKAKARAKMMCHTLKIQCRNHNEAEAAMIALWGCACSQIYRALAMGIAV